jgi:hypothetical protein
MKDALKEARRKLAGTSGCYDRTFAGDDGQKVLADLHLRFGGTTLRRNNGVIDPNDSIAAAGCREVLLYIDNMRKKRYVVDE